MGYVMKLLGGLVGLSLLAATAAAKPPETLGKSVDDFLSPLLRTNNFSGVVLVAEGDRIVFAKGYGFASLGHRVPNSPATVFQIASVSKPFTAAAVMLLVEQGKLGLKAPLSAVLPGYPNGDKLTIHHLLTHTSGIPNINDFDVYAEVQRRPNQTGELVALFKDKPLEFEPGARYDYSNSNYNLLAHIIEKVSGEDFGTHLRRAIFDRVPLKRTAHPLSAQEVVADGAAGYAPLGSLGLQRAAYIDWSAKTGNGSLRSDAAGVMQFMRAVHRGRLLAPDSLAATFTPHTPNVGYGWFLTKANGRDIHHANGRSPGFAAQADHYVADDVTVVVLANTYVSVTTPIARAVGALYFGQPVTPMPALKPDPLPARAVAAIAGTYQFGPDYYVPNARIRVHSSGGQVEAAVEGADSYALVPIDDTHFLMRSFWVPADFTLGADGRAAEMRIDGFKGQRVP